jgi:hypothetical protein
VPDREGQALLFRKGEITGRIAQEAIADTLVNIIKEVKEERIKA